MKRSEFQEAHERLVNECPNIQTAIGKFMNGDVRGARVRLERAIQVAKEIEETLCNDAGFLNDPDGE